MRCHLSSHTNIRSAMYARSGVARALVLIIGCCSFVGGGGAALALRLIAPTGATAEELAAAETAVGTAVVVTLVLESESALSSISVSLCGTKFSSAA